MPRLPTPGSDNGTWGEVLNEFLGVEHNSDGSLKASGSLAGKTDMSILTAKGDMYVATAASTPARLAAGTNGYVLTADSTAASGIAWIAPATFVTPTADQATTSVTVENIPALAMNIGIGSYEFEFYIPYTGSVSGASGLLLNLEGPSTSFLSYTMNIQSSNTTHSTFFRNVFDDDQAGVVITTAGTLYSARISGYAVTTAAGILQPQFGITNNGTTTTAKVGMYGKLIKRP
jgi:hypothetical protein